jgi:peroxiredoxin Q/BCP
MYGRQYMGIERSTFVIDAEGKISAILEKVKPDEHLSQLEGLL